MSLLRCLSISVYLSAYHFVCVGLYFAKRYTAILLSYYTALGILTPLYVKIFSVAIIATLVDKDDLLLSPFIARILLRIYSFGMTSI